MQGMDIGFIGLGQMGFPMARRLIEAGHTLTVYDIRKDAVDRLVALGAQAAGSMREVADRVETILLSLPTPDIVEAVTVGKGGLIEGNRLRRVVDLSTTGSVMAKKIFETLKAREIVQIDSPVSGGVSGAEKGTLAVMVSGPRDEAMALEPVLSVIGKFFFIGEQPGSGQTMKLCNNVLSATAMAATSESVVTGVKAGLDPRVMIDVINAGSGRNTASESKFPKNIIPRTFDLGFTNGLMMKDVKLFLSEAEALGVPVEVSKAVAHLLQMACTEVGAEADLTTIVQPIEKRAGAEVKAPKA
jgi:3-hydroxyisobutyrate dehydrogenase-like beta-hydroxyacid dehydrogenase